MRDNVEKGRGSHLSSAVNLLGGPRPLILFVWGSFSFLKCWDWIILNIPAKVKN